MPWCKQTCAMFFHTALMLMLDEHGYADVAAVEAPRGRSIRAGVYPPPGSGLYIRPAFRVRGVRLPSKGGPPSEWGKQISDFRQKMKREREEEDDEDDCQGGSNAEEEDLEKEVVVKGDLVSAVCRLSQQPI